MLYIYKFIPIKYTVESVLFYKNIIHYLPYNMLKFTVIIIHLQHGCKKTRNLSIPFIQNSNDLKVIYDQSNNLLQSDFFNFV